MPSGHLSRLGGIHFPHPSGLWLPSKSWEPHTVTEQQRSASDNTCWIHNPVANPQGHTTRCLTRGNTCYYPITQDSLQIILANFPRNSYHKFPRGLKLDYNPHTLFKLPYPVTYYQILAKSFFLYADLFMLVSFTKLNSFCLRIYSEVLKIKPSKVTISGYEATCNWRVTHQGPGLFFTLVFGCLLSAE